MTAEPPRNGPQGATSDGAIVGSVVEPGDDDGGGVVFDPPAGVLGEGPHRHGDLCRVDADVALGGAVVAGP